MYQNGLGCLRLFQVPIFFSSGPQLGPMRNIMSMATAEARCEIGGSMPYSILAIAGS